MKKLVKLHGAFSFAQDNSAAVGTRLDSEYQTRKVTSGDTAQSSSIPGFRRLKL